MKITKKNTFGTQFVLSQLMKSGPSSMEMISPSAV